MVTISLAGFAVDDTKALAVARAVLATIRVASAPDVAPADLVAGLTAASAQVIHQTARLKDHPEDIALSVAALISSLVRGGGPGL